MQGPTFLKRLFEVRYCISFYKGCCIYCSDSRSVGPVVTYDRTTDQIYLFIAVNVNRKVYESSLDFRPLVARFSGKTVGILLECLMQDPYDDEPSATPGSPFGKFLKQEKIGIVVRGALKEFPHLIDENK